MTSVKTLATSLRRRTKRRSVIVDMNADYVGRRPSGDPRLDLAYSDRWLR